MKKWEPALIPLFLISVNTIFAAATTHLTNLLNAIGKIKVTFKLMVMWTILTWATIPFLAIKYGVNGVAAGYALVGASSVIAIFIVYKIVQFSLIESVFRPLLGALVMGIILFSLQSLLPINLLSVIILTLSGIIIYLLTMYILVGPSIIADAKKGLRSAISR